MRSPHSRGESLDSPSTADSWSPNWRQRQVIAWGSRFEMLLAGVVTALPPRSSKRFPVSIQYLFLVLHFVLDRWAGEFTISLRCATSDTRRLCVQCCKNNVCFYSIDQRWQSLHKNSDTKFGFTFWLNACFSRVRSTPWRILTPIMANNIVQLFETEYETRSRNLQTIRLYAFNACSKSNSKLLFHIYKTRQLTFNTCAPNPLILMHLQQYLWLDGGSANFSENVKLQLWLKMTADMLLCR